LKGKLLVGSVVLLLLIAAVQQVRERVYVRGLLVAVLDSFRYSPAALGDGGAASDLRLFNPMGIAMGPAGELFVVDRGIRGEGGRIIWRIDPDGTVDHVAGSGRREKPRAGTPAKESDFLSPEGLTLGPDGLLYFADGQAKQVFRIEANGILSLVAGTGIGGVGGDGGPAVQASLDNPVDVRFDPGGNLYIADVYNHRIRRVSPEGIIETVAGNGLPGYSGDGGPATEAQLDYPWGVFVDPFTGNLLIADSNNHRVREVDSAGRISSRAGWGELGYGGDGGDAHLARLDSPQSLGFDCAGRMYIGDEHNHVIRVVDLDGTIRTLVGTGAPGLARDGSAGIDAALNDPENMVVLCDGTVFLTDGENGRVLSVAPDGTVRHVAGRPP
jgi:DNA-binding beta-propeller fold protein YncE